MNRVNLGAYGYLKILECVSEVSFAMVWCVESRDLVQELREAIQFARSRVYQVGQPTPLERFPLGDTAAEVWVKREDLGPIKAFKWRGAFNAMACLSPEELSTGVVTASAGNHAQGIALAAKHLGAKAHIYMPTPTPAVKQEAVLAHGGGCVSVKLVGDSFAESQQAAFTHAKETGAIFVPPYDSLQVMAGQGTIADEIFASGVGPFDYVYIAIGGGGMAAAVGTLLKSVWPGVKIIGVEGTGQASMMEAFRKGEPAPLDYVDVFCDGTAVTQVGSLTYEICRTQVDEIVTVTNEEVSSAIQRHWNGLRTIPEPSGAMSLAGYLKQAREGGVPDGAKVLTILCGANMDFAKLADISRQAEMHPNRYQSWKFAIPEEKGSLVALLTELPNQINITDLQYGRTSGSSQAPVLTLDVPSESQEDFDHWLASYQSSAVEVTHRATTRYRTIPFTLALMKAPIFVEVEFPERAGALLGFMKNLSKEASLCYFNYTYSGERVGRALLGLDFCSEKALAEHGDTLFSQEGETVRSVKEVSIEDLA